MEGLKDSVKSIKTYIIITALVLISRYFIVFLNFSSLDTIMEIVYLVSKIVGLILLLKLILKDYSLIKLTKYIYFFNIVYFSINYLSDYILFEKDNMSLIYIIFFVIAFNYILNTEQKLSF